MVHRVSVVAVVVLLVLINLLPLVGIGLWVAVFVLGTTPPFWLAVLVVGGTALIVAGLIVQAVGRRIHTV